MLHPEFRSTSSVVTPSLTPPASTFVPAPGQPSPGAVVFPSGTTTPSVPPPASENPLPPPPTQNFSRPTLSVHIEPHPLYPVAAGSAFLLQVRVANTGTTDAKNVAMLVPLPQEFRGQEINAGWEQLATTGETEGKPADWQGNIETLSHRATLQIPVLAAGKTAQFWVLYPTIGSQGYDITCIVLVDRQEVARKTQQIKP